MRRPNPGDAVRLLLQAETADGKAQNGKDKATTNNSTTHDNEENPRKAAIGSNVTGIDQTAYDFAEGKNCPRKWIRDASTTNNGPSDRQTDHDERKAYPGGGSQVERVTFTGRHGDCQRWRVKVELEFW